MSTRRVTLKPGERQSVRARPKPGQKYTDKPIVIMDPGDVVIVSHSEGEPEPPPPPPPPPPPSGGIYTSAAELAGRPMSGSGWDQVRNMASSTFAGSPLSTRDDDNCRILAGALYHARTGDAAMKAKVITGLTKMRNQDIDTGDLLAACRRLGTYAIAADLVGYTDPQFKAWVDTERKRQYSGGSGGGTIISIHDKRPNNWGGHAAASRMAAALYIGDTADFDRAVTVMKGWLGDRGAYAGFVYNQEEWEVWQADPSKPVGVNPKGAVKQGHSIDGVLPDDQRRTLGGFKWPPPKENYVYEALQGMFVAAVIAQRKGVAIATASDSALLRAIKWLYEQCNFPAEGDDTGTMGLVNHLYGTSYAVGLGVAKNIAFQGWTHG